MPPLITLLTDFGLADSYVAEVKAVLAAQAHSAQLIDVTHHISPGDIRAGQYILSRVWHRFPPGTVHLVVVDPGVGTPRRALAAEASGHYFVAPDNGILSCLPEGTRFLSLPIPPAAALIANGTALTHLGQAISDPVRAPLPTPRHDGTTVVGEVIYVDRFGTLISNIPGGLVEPGVRIKVADADAGALRRTYGEVARGKLVAYVGSGGTVEIAVRDGSAARLLGVGVGAQVRA